MAPGNYNLTQVYQVFDLTPVAKTNDPRFNYLDAAVSSRSTLAAADVWAFPNRTLTGFTLDQASVASIWSYLVSQATTPHSLGALLVANLTGPTGNAATQAQVEYLLSGVAQDSTVAGLASLIGEGNVTTQNLVNSVLTVTNSVQAKTNNLPPDPASEGNIIYEIGQVAAELTSTQLSLSLVKAKTDNLPAQPASEISLLQIPTNPLLTTDARLLNLDVRISTRSVLALSDLASLATAQNVNNSTNLILAALEITTSAANTAATAALHAQQQTQNLPLDPAASTDVTQSTATLLAAIEHIAPGGGGATAAEVWSYANRTITQDPESFGPDISNLSTHADVAAVNQYVNMMSTSFDATSGTQEIIAWATQNGQVVRGTNCTIVVKDALGNQQWAQTLATPNNDGVFTFTNPIVLDGNADYYVVISITVNGSVRTNQQPFITVD